MCDFQLNAIVHDDAVRGFEFAFDWLDSDRLRQEMTKIQEGDYKNGGIPQKSGEKRYGQFFL